MRISDWSSDVCSSDLRDVQRNTPQERHAHVLRRRFSATCAERIGHFAAMGTGITRHIFNKADHRNIRLLEQADGARCVDQREILGRRYDRSEEHTSELQSLMSISYAVFCLKKTNTKKHN